MKAKLDKALKFWSNISLSRTFACWLEWCDNVVELRSRTLVSRGKEWIAHFRERVAETKKYRLLVSDFSLLRTERAKLKIVASWASFASERAQRREVGLQVSSSFKRKCVVQMVERFICFFIYLRPSVYDSVVFFCLVYLFCVFLFIYYICLYLFVICLLFFLFTIGGH